MKNFIESIEKSLVEENWQAAIFMSICLPDICGAITYSDVKFAGDRYKNWYNSNLLEFFTEDKPGFEQVFLTDKDMWSIRCSLLHAGTDYLDEQKSKDIISKVYFTISSIHLALVEDRLVLEVREFCRTICFSVERWYERVKHLPETEKKIARILKIHENTFSPYPGVEFR